MCSSFGFKHEVACRGIPNLVLNDELRNIEYRYSRCTSEVDGVT